MTDNNDDKFIYGDNDIAGLTIYRKQPKPEAKAVEPELVKVRRNAIDRALDLLAAMPDSEPNKIAVPWRIMSRPKIQTDDWAYSKLQNYAITELVATQQFIKRDDVEWHIINFNHVPEGHNMNPNVVIDEGEPKIYDGHHRLIALWLMGADYANCWTLEK